MRRGTPAPISVRGGREEARGGELGLLGRLLPEPGADSSIWKDVELFMADVVDD